jgi:hypothetical protein
MSVATHRTRSSLPGRPEPPRTLGGPVRKVALVTFFASVVVNAALGIYAVLSPDFGDTQGKILATSLCVTGALVIALACEPAWERKLLGPVPLLGAGLGAVAFGLMIANLWAEPETDVLGKVMGTILVGSVGLTLASLLALARLAPQHAWIGVATYTLLTLGAGLQATLVWLEDPGSWFMRPYGVVMIALAACVVTMPVVHWIDRGATAVAEATDVIRYCPYCGRGIGGEPGAGLGCQRCGREFTVTPSAGSRTESVST